MSRMRVGGLTEATVTLEHVAQVLAQRLADLEGRLQGDDKEIWSSYTEAATALASVMPNLTPDRRGELLTTAQMAARLGIRPKTLLKRKAKGQIRPTLQAGKLIRWRGTEPVS